MEESQETKPEELTLASASSKFIKEMAEETLALSEQLASYEVEETFLP